MSTLLVILALHAATARPREERRPAAGTRKISVVTWTDIHFGNEKYEPTAWREAYDGGCSLHPDVVAMTGDQMDNKCSKEEFLDRQDAFLRELSQRLDKLEAPVMITYGNNDFYANYQTDPEVLKTTTDAYARWLGKYVYLDALGNGVYPRTVAGMTWISVNSQIFSQRNRYAGRGQQADRTFAWLGARLSSLPRGRPVVLLLHIPPSYDLYDGGLSWRPQDLQKLGELLKNYRGPVVLLSAHYHRNEVHAFTVPGRGPVPLLVAGSASFKYGNFPNWRSSQWTLSPDGSVARFDWVNHYPGHPAWDAAWNLVAPYAPSTYRALAESLRDNLEAYLAYMVDLYAHNADWKKWADDPRTRPMLVEQVAPPHIAEPGPASRHRHRENLCDGPATLLDLARDVFDVALARGSSGQGNPEGNSTASTRSEPGPSRIPARGQ